MSNTRFPEGGAGAGIAGNIVARHRPSHRAYAAQLAAVVVVVAVGALVLVAACRACRGR